jgi:hypothetical protein
MPMTPIEPPETTKKRVRRFKKPQIGDQMTVAEVRAASVARNQAAQEPQEGLKGYFDAQLQSNSRDVANFPIDEQPGITDAQLIWLSERLSAESDNEACELAHYDTYIVKMWKMQPAFASVYDLVMNNKREGFKYLVTQALPKVLRTLLADLDDGNGRTRMAAATLILRTNGMLIDKVQRTDPDGVIRLMEMMRQVSPIQPMLIEPRE